MNIINLSHNFIHFDLFFVLEFIEIYLRDFELSLFWSFLGAFWLDWIFILFSIFVLFFRKLDKNLFSSFLSGASRARTGPVKPMSSGPLSTRKFSFVWAEQTSLGPESLGALETCKSRSQIKYFLYFPIFLLFL